MTIKLNLKQTFLLAVLLFGIYYIYISNNKQSIQLPYILNTNTDSVLSTNYL